MKVDKSTQDTDLSSIPSEFRENYRFLSELINCKNKNDSVSQGLASLVHERFLETRAMLNRRQIKILNHYLKGMERNDPEFTAPPVPVELEASIRVRKRSTWLPWEAEAIRKIDRWREDVVCIIGNWNGNSSFADGPKCLRPKQSRLL
ncbi:MAG: hypothetical protein WCJ75_08500 [Desulfomonile sp.]|jgi:hypothetical protein